MSIYDELEQILVDIELPTGFELRLLADFTVDSKFHRYYLQVRCWREDTITRQMGWGYGGKAYLSPHMVKSEVVQTAFGLYKAFLEHEARESFKYRGRRVYGPHMDVDALWEVAQRVDVRKEKT